MDSDPTPLIIALTDVEIANKRVMNLTRRLAEIESETLEIKKKIYELKKK